MRLFKGKITYNQHVSATGSEKNSTIITAHECQTEGVNQINANSNVGTNIGLSSETDIEAGRAKEKLSKNGQNTKEKKETLGDKNGEYEQLTKK